MKGAGLRNDKREVNISSRFLTAEADSEWQGGWSVVTRVKSISASWGPG